jgi:arylsulfatase A-like enzyme
LLALVAGFCSGCSEPEPELGPGWVTVESPEEAGPISIVLISMDTLRADRLGVYGNSDGLTPNLDRFASEAIVFDHAFAQSNETLFSHASLFTSRYPSELGPVDYTFDFPDEVPTLAEVLALYGYETGAMVAGGHLSPVFGLDRGFDTYEMPREWGSLFHTRRAASRWLDGLEEDQPFFLFVHGYDTHTRYLKPAPFGLLQADADYNGSAVQATREITGTIEIVEGVWFEGLVPREIFDLSALRLRSSSGPPLRALPSSGTPMWPADLQHVEDVYDGAVRYGDAMFGWLMADLAERGVLENSVVVLLSDHGEELGEYGMYSHRAWLTPETQRVP